MSITIRLSRFGRKNAPSFRMVVANTKSKRDGKYIDKVGVYNPSVTPALFDFDKKKFEEWVGKGALVSDSVKELIDGKYEFKAYRKGKVVGSEEAQVETK